MSAFDDAMQDAVPIFFDTLGEDIDWDDARLQAIVEDIEDNTFGVDTGAAVERKKVVIKAADIYQVPESGNEILLRFDPFKADGGDYWTVESVISSSGMHDVTFIRYTSL